MRVYPESARAARWLQQPSILEILDISWKIPEINTSSSWLVMVLLLIYIYIYRKPHIKLFWRSEKLNFWRYDFNTEKEGCTRTCNGDDVTNEHVYWYTTVHVETSSKGNKRKRKVIFMGQLFSYAQPATERANRNFMFIAKRKSIAEHNENKISVNCGMILSRRKFLKYENSGMTLDCRTKNCLF